MPHPDDLAARLFCAALRVRAGDREAFVRRACRGDLAAAAVALADLEAFAQQDDRFDRHCGRAVRLTEAAIARTGRPSRMPKSSTA